MRKIVVIGKDSSSTKILVNSLLQHNFRVDFVEERRTDKLNLLKNRVQRFGVARVMLQLVFQVYQRFLTSKSRRRLNQIVGECKADLCPIQVFSDINNREAINFITSLDRDLIVLSGTRIVSTDFLESIPTPIINIHAGITPKYRGVHGGYWALVNDDIKSFGATIHWVDDGIDTGTVIKYSYCQPSATDNFATYPLVQQKAATSDLIDILNSDRLMVAKEEFVTGISYLWSHPTIVQYIKNGLRQGIS